MKPLWSTAAVFFMTAAFADRSLADERTVAARLRCGAGVAVIEFARAWNADPVFRELPDTLGESDLKDATPRPEFECNLAGAGREMPLKVKIGLIPGRPWGQCGGVEKWFLSLWLDRRRVLSRRFFDNPCTDFDDLDLIVVRPEGMTFCARANSEPNFRWEDDPDPAAPLTCMPADEIVRAALGGPVDEVQYPPDGSLRQEGKVVLLESRNDALCSALFHEFSEGRDFHDALTGDHWAGRVTPVAWSAGPMGDTGPVEVDIDNDGTAERIAVAPYGPGSSGEELVELQPGVAYRPEDIYALRPVIPIVDTVFARDAPPGQEPYVLPHPFVWDGETFVLMATVYDPRPPEWAVYQVAPDRSIEEVCVLDRVPVHY